MSAFPSLPSATFEPSRLPGEDELPYDDGEPVESTKHLDAMNLLIETARYHVREREDVFIAGNLGIYFSPMQIRRNDFRAPDFMAVLGVSPRHRKSWVCWQENGRVPDVVIEVLSEGTAEVDLGEKVHIYETLGVREYFINDPMENTLVGYRLERGHYKPIPTRADGEMECQVLGLRLGIEEGTVGGRQDLWLRWKTPDGKVVPSGAERADRLAARLKALGVDPEE